VRGESAVGHEAEPSKADDDEQEEGAPGEDHEKADGQQSLRHVEDSANRIADRIRISHGDGEPRRACRRNNQRKRHEGKDDEEKTTAKKPPGALLIVIYPHGWLRSRLVQYSCIDEMNAPNARQQEQD
jgi:hypothetical protein